MNLLWWISGWLQQQSCSMCQAASYSFLRGASWSFSVDMVLGSTNSSIQTFITCSFVLIANSYNIVFCYWSVDCKRQAASLQTFCLGPADWFCSKLFPFTIWWEACTQCQEWKMAKRKKFQNQIWLMESCSYLLVYHTTRHPASFSQEAEDMTNPWKPMSNISSWYPYSHLCTQIKFLMDPPLCYSLLLSYLLMEVWSKKILLLDVLHHPKTADRNQMHSKHLQI